MLWNWFEKITHDRFQSGHEDVRAAADRSLSEMCRLSVSAGSKSMSISGYRPAYKVGRCWGGRHWRTPRCCRWTFSVWWWWPAGRCWPPPSKCRPSRGCSAPAPCPCRPSASSGSPTTPPSPSSIATPSTCPPSSRWPSHRWVALRSISFPRLWDWWWYRW